MAKSKRDSEAAYRARKLAEVQQQQAAAQRKRTVRIILIVAALAMAVLATVVVPMLTRDENTDPQVPIAAIGVTADAASCSAETRQPPAPDWTSHTRETVRYQSIPPAGGPHDPTTLPLARDHFYERSENPRPERAVHDLEHGVVVGWYDTGLSDADVAVLKQVSAAAAAAKLRFVAVPWPGDPFEDERHFVLTAWGVTQRCSAVSGAAVQAFVQKHADAPGLPERTFPV